MYHLWEVLLKYWFIRILRCLSTVLIRGREHRQDSEKPIGNLFSCLHRCPQTQQTFEISILWWFHAWYRLCKRGSRFPHQKGIYSPLTQLQPSQLGSHFLERSKALSDNWTPPTNHSTLAFTVWHSAPFLRLLYKMQPLPAALTSSAYSHCPHCLYVLFHFCFTPLFLCFWPCLDFPFSVYPLLAFPLICHECSGRKLLHLPGPCMSQKKFLEQ